MLHHSHPQQMHNCSNNSLASTASPSVIKCISVDTPSMQPPRDIPDACLNNTGVSYNPLATAAFPSASGFNLEDSINDDLVTRCKNSIPQSIHLQDNADPTENVRELRSNNQCAKEATTQTTSCAFAPDVLSSCSGNSFIMNSSNESSPHINYVESDQTAVTSLSTFDNLKPADEKSGIESAGESQRHTNTGQVYDV